MSSEINQKTLVSIFKVFLAVSLLFTMFLATSSVASAEKIVEFWLPSTGCVNDTDCAANGCTDDASVTITMPAELIATITASNDPLCNGQTGDATGYFTYGMGPDLYTAYNFKTPFGYFGLGIYSSLIYFTAEGLLIDSDNLLISAGPEIRLGIDANQFLGIFLRINGGATIFMLNKNNEGYESTIIPFVSGGMGMTLNITPGFGIVLSTNYSLYIESSILITGFSPSAGIFLRL